MDIFLVCIIEIKTFDMSPRQFPALWICVQLIGC